MTSTTFKLLLVDDCLKDRETYQSYLLSDKQHNYTILEAETGEQALLLYQQQFPDVIITDYLLPDMHALDFLHRLKVDFGQTNPPVIIVTNQGNEQIAVQTMKGGAADYLVKKNTTQISFIKAVEEVLEKTHQTLQIKESKAVLLEANSELERRVQQRTTKLQQANEELEIAFEELQIAQDELRQQNEKLAISRQAIELERQHYRDLFEFAPDGYLVTDTQGNIRQANSAAVSLLCVQQQHLIGKPLVIFIVEPERKSFRTRLVNLQQAQDWEVYLKPRLGEAFPAMVAVTSIHNQQGQQVGWRWLLRDIRLRKQMEQRLQAAYDELEKRVEARTAELSQSNALLQQKNELLQTIFDHVPVMMVLFDPNGHIQWANREWETVLGWRVQEIQGRELLPEFYPDPEYCQYVLDFIAAGERRWGEFRTRTKDGQILDTTWANIRLTDGTTIGIGQDTSDRKRREANAAFLAEIAEDLSRLSFAEDIMQTVGAKVGTYLGISSCLFAEINEVQDQVAVEYTWHAADTADLIGIYRLSDLITEEFLQAARSGETVIIDNTQTDPRTDKERYGALQIYAYVSVPFHRDGEWKYLFTVNDSVVRNWREDEIELIREVTARTFPRLERARAEAAVAADLKDTQLLRDLSARLISEDNIQVLYDEILAAAIVLMRADGGSFQVLDEATQQLVLLASRKSDENMIDHYEQVDTRLNTSCSIALKTRERSFINFDVSESDEPNGYLGMYLKAGYVCAQSTPLISRSGKLIGMVSTYWRSHHRPSDRELGFLDLLARQAGDLIERRQAELQIRKFVSLVDNSTEFIGMCDVNFMPLYLNLAGMQLVGLDHLRYRETPVREYFFPEDQGFIINEFFPRVLREGRAEVEIRFRHFQTGEALWMLYSVFCIKDTNDQIIGLATVSRNITERKFAQEKIQEQAALLDVVTEAIFVCDLKCRVLYWNPGAERMYGWRAAEILNKDYREFLYKEISPSVRQALTTVIEKGEWHGEVNKITKFRQEIIVSSHLTLLRDDAGQPKSILAVNTDITAKKQLESQFYRAQRLESLGTLASGIAHDLNNVLTPILAVSQLLPLKFANLNEQNRQLLRILEDNSKRGAQLVKQIVSFARGAEGKRVPVQLKSLLEEVAQVVKSTFPKSIEICTNIATPNLWTVSADPTQIHQVLMNLCVNARDAMPNGGTLSISALNFHVDENYARTNLEAKVGDYVVITVSDTGCGMSQTVKERIFEPFFTTKEPGKGTGLGLSSVIGIIKNHDGFVNVHSQVGEGSQFQVFLSAIKTSVTPETQELQTISLGNSELILVVDDEAFVRDLVKTSLEQFNYRVVTARDSIDAFSLYVQYANEISLVLMDIQMPSIDGFKAIRVLQQINPTVKIIAMSGLASSRNLLKVNDIAVKEFLSKPFTINELLDTVKGVLSAV